MSLNLKSQKIASPNLQSKDLQEAFTSNASTFENHLATINAISADIKAAEQYLQSKHLTVEYSAMLHKCSLSTPSQVYSLAWGAINSDSNYRLLVNQWWRDRDELQPPEIVTSLPLIEAPLQVRLAVFPFLPAFINMFAQSLREDQNKAGLHSELDSF